jgi:hypothetical protein
MDDQIINIPGVGDVTFPAGMSDDDIAVAAKRLHTEANMPSAPKMIANEKRTAGPFDDRQHSGALLPGPREFAERMVNAAVDVPVGVAKLFTGGTATNPTQTAGKAIGVAAPAAKIGTAVVRTAAPAVRAAAPVVGEVARVAGREALFNAFPRTVRYGKPAAEAVKKMIADLMRRRANPRLPF